MRKAKDGKTAGQRIAEDMPEWEYVTVAYEVGETFERPTGKGWNLQRTHVVAHGTGQFLMVVVVWYRVNV